MNKPLPIVPPLSPCASPRARAGLFAVTSAALWLAGCATPEQGMVPAPLLDKAALRQSGQQSDDLETSVRAERQMRTETTPQVPVASHVLREHESGSDTIVGGHAEDDDT